MLAQSEVNQSRPKASKFGSLICNVWVSFCIFKERRESSKELKNNGSAQECKSDDEIYSKNTYHYGIINRAYLPMQLVLVALGRWPFILSLQSGNDEQHSRGRLFYKSQVLNYSLSLNSVMWAYFVLTSLFLMYALIMSTLGFLDFFLGWDLLPEGRWEVIQKTTFRSNLVMFLLVWGCLLHSTVSSFAMFFNRNKIAFSLYYWNVAAEELQIGSLQRHRRFLIIANLVYVMFLVLVYSSYSWFNIRFVRDGATLFGTLAIRPLLNEEQLNSTAQWKLRVFGILMIIYVGYASRAFLLLFCFKCRILRTMFRVWNSRLSKYLESKENGDLAKEKQQSQQILKQMTVLLKMVKQQDDMFATVLQSYYAIQLINMCFELYMLAKSGTGEVASSNDSTRSLDIVSALITLIQNVYLFLTVSLDGAYVSEEAAEGVDILRKHHVTPHCNVYRKYLVHNLSFIYQHKITLTGGKFFVIDRPFIITVLGAVFTYFIIVLQMEPSPHKDN